MYILFVNISLAVNMAIMEGLATESANEEVEQWGRYELILNHTGTYANPFAEVNLSATFKHGDRSVTVHGFCNGDNVWKVRFMPDEQGRWEYTTASNDPGLNEHSGFFKCIPPGSDNHGPIVIRNTFHFAHADGTPFYPLGTTLYNWLHRSPGLEEQTLDTLRNHAFNKVRFCVFPKWYPFNKVEPPIYPYVQTDKDKFDLDRFNPAYFWHIESRVQDLLEMGIVADVILFHPYDRWGFSKMDAAHDEAYLRYVMARLAAYRNVWWTMANEYDLVKPPKDWDRIFQIVRDCDPYGHPRSNHNCREWYDHSKPWATHCNIQNHDVYKTTIGAREKYGKPVVIDEYGYEGNIDKGWGNKSAKEEVHRHWSLTMAGGYGSHGETYQHPDDLLWWAIGGKLHGGSPARLGFLKDIMTGVPYEEMSPEPDMISDGYCLAKKGSYYLFYLMEKRPTTLKLSGNHDFQLESIDPWNMKIEDIGSVPVQDYTFVPPEVPWVVRATAVSLERGE